MKKASEEALERFDKATQDLSLLPLGLSFTRRKEIVQEYEWAKAEIMEQLK